MPKFFITLLLFAGLFFGFHRPDLPAADMPPERKTAEEMQILMRADIPSLMRTSELIGKLGSQAFHDFSSLVVMATLGFMLAPELGDVNLVTPVSFFLVNNPATPDPPFFVLMARKRREIPAKKIRFAGQNFYTFEKEGFLFLAGSKDFGTLLTTKTFSPPPGRPPGMLSASFDLLHFTQSVSLETMTRSFLDSVQKTDQADSRKSTKTTALPPGLQNCIERIETLLNQFDHLSFRMDPDPEMLISELTVTPRNGAILERLRFPVSTETDYAAELARNTQIAALLSPAFLKALREEFRDYWITPEFPGKLRGFVDKLLTHAESVTASAGTVGDDFFSETQIKIKSSDFRVFEKSMENFPKTDARNCFLLYTDPESGNRLYCRLDPKDREQLVLCYSVFAPEELELLLRDRVDCRLKTAALWSIFKYDSESGETKNLASFTQTPPFYSLKTRIAPGELRAFFFLLR